MNKPLTVLKTVEDVDNAPDGTVVETASRAVFEIVLQSRKDYVKKRLPARVLRWGEDYYPAKFEQVIKTLADMSLEEREECQWMQCDFLHGKRGAILQAGKNFSMVIDEKGMIFDPLVSDVIPRFDLPRMVWPGEEPKEPPAVSEWVGRELSTAQDFEGAPVGTVCTDREGDPALKQSEDQWSYVGAVNLNKNMENEPYGPFTVIAVAEP